MPDPEFPTADAPRTFTDVSTAFPIVPESAAAARRYVAAACRRFAADDERAVAAVQLASEVVAWAYRHGTAPLRLAVAAPDPAAVTVHMTVHHDGSVPEIEPTVVRLLDHIASEWTVQSDARTSTLRFVLRAPADPPTAVSAGGQPGMTGASDTRR